MRTIYFAKWILLPDGSILENGGISIENRLITELGTRSRIRRTHGERIVNLGDLLLLPGFINMHTHLEEGILRGFSRAPDQSFSSYHSKKTTMMKQAPDNEIMGAVRLGIRESIAYGTTTIVDTSRRGISPSVMCQEPIRSWVIHEFHQPDDCSEESLFDTIIERLNSNTRGVKYGVGPHALFSLTPRGHKKTIAMTRQAPLRWSSHLAESSEELQAFSEQSGDLFFQITRNRPWPYGSNPMGPMHYALTNNLIPNSGICVHCNYITGHELVLLAAKQASVVVCPQYAHRQGHKHFPLDVALKRGIRICVATESVSDTESTNLFDELFYLHSNYPHIPPYELIKWVTKNPAEALGCGLLLGSLESGKYADIIGVSFRHNPGEDILEELLVEEPVVRFVCVNGEDVIVDC